MQLKVTIIAAGFPTDNFLGGEAVADPLLATAAAARGARISFAD